MTLRTGMVTSDKKRNAGGFRKLAVLWSVDLSISSASCMLQPVVIQHALQALIPSFVEHLVELSQSEDCRPKIKGKHPRKTMLGASEVLWKVCFCGTRITTVLQAWVFLSMPEHI